MIQLYFLSIICNTLAGYILFADDNGIVDDKVKISINNPTFQLILGIVSIATGILKILSPSIGGFPIIGDLVPATAGIVSGFMLIFGIYRKNNSSDLVTKGSLDALAVSLLKYNKPIGIGLFFTAILHFLFPAALFL
ncbi:MAG: hypothetical protein FWC19_01050 [Treponema sp.]|nr:hypothetical protein [Treponema sp.]MCL2271380.1 hypothetical protein [Treponema sp.]